MPMCCIPPAPVFTYLMYAPLLAPRVPCVWTFSAGLDVFVKALFVRRRRPPGPRQNVRVGGERETDLEKAAVRFLVHLSAERNLSPHTVRAYERDLVAFEQFVERKGA